MKFPPKTDTSATSNNKFLFHFPHKNNDEIEEVHHDFSTDNDNSKQFTKTEQSVFQRDNSPNINNRVTRHNSHARNEGRTYEFCNINHKHPTSHENRPFLKIYANDNDQPIYLLVDSGAQRSVMRASELARIN